MPSRTRKPDIVDYIALDKATFKDLVLNYGAAIKKQLEVEITYGIRVDGFDGVFDSIDEFIESLTDKEWKSIEKITLYYYSEPYSQYGEIISLDFGGWSFNAIGLRITYGTKMSDIQHLALKQDSDRLVENYRRHVIFKRKQVSFIGSLLLICGIILFALLNNWFGIRLKDPSNPTALFLLAGLTIWLGFALLWCLYFAISSAHKKLIPPFEIINENGRNRYSLLKRYFVLFGAWIGFIAAIPVIIDLITRVLQGK